MYLWLFSCSRCGGFWLHSFVVSKKKKTKLGMLSSVLGLLRLLWWPRMWCNAERVPHGWEESELMMMEILGFSARSIWSIMLAKSAVSLLPFCLDPWWKWGVKSYRAIRHYPLLSLDHLCFLHVLRWPESYTCPRFSSDSVIRHPDQKLPSEIVIDIIAICVREGMLPS